MLGILFACGSCRTNDPRQDYEVWSLGCQWTLLGSCGSRTVDPDARVGPQDHLVRHRLCSNVTLILSDWLGQTQAAGPKRGPGGL
jgi:hypothetical protein